MRRQALCLILTLAGPSLALTELRFEAEDVSTPTTAWRRDRGSADRWNLWSTDVDAASKWSGGIVLQSPKVLTERAHPEDGAPVLHTRITGLPAGRYDITIKSGRTLAVSRDGTTWQPFRGGLFLTEHRIDDGVFELWVDDRYVHTDSPGHAYYDCVIFTPIPAIVPKPRVHGHAAQRITEALDRGLVALRSDGGVYLSWRLLRDDPADQGFVLYRQAGDGARQRLTPQPHRATTDWLDRAAPRGRPLVYLVEPTHGDITGRATLAPDAPPYLGIRLDGDPTVQKLGLGDLDGDGHLDLVLKQPNANVDPYEAYWKRSTEPYQFEAVRHDGTLLWRRDLGWAIERGIWYSPFLVHDLDGDGRAEVAVKVGEGDPRDPDGRVRTGPEWLAIWDGATGRTRTRVPWPSREPFAGNYNRFSRNQLAVAYLDGKTPCLVALRGTYDVMLAEAYELVGDTLRPLWTYRDAEGGRRYRGQGAHFTQCVDLDGDGRDEILLGSAVIDDNGSPLWSTGFGHPDHAYCGDLDPRRPGLEIYYGLETRRPDHGMCLVAAATGEVLWGWNEPTRHVHGKGICGDLDAASPGCEFYSCDIRSAAKDPGRRFLWTVDGRVHGRDLDVGFGCSTVYWDADPEKELVRGNRVTDLDGTVRGRLEGRLVQVVDLLGDWREELVVTLPGELRIYTTTIPAHERRVTLLQDPLYRLDTTMNAMGYTQNPMLSHVLK